MDIEEFRKYCMAKKGVTESFPFDESTLVFKVGTKMFTCLDINKDILKVNLKCDPVVAMGLRDRYKAVTPGYYMNKLHWNTVEFDGSIPEDELKEMIFKNVSDRVAEMIKEEMDYAGPIRLSVVEEAQQRIVEVVRRLEEEQQIVIVRGGEGGEVFV